MIESNVKEGFALAEKEMRENQVKEVKNIVLKTLEKIKEQEKIRDEAARKIKILKMDIDDLKDGKIDRIVERQEKDEEAKKISVVVIIKEKEVHHHYDYWYWPYRIIWNYPVVPYYPDQTVYCGAGYSLTSTTGSTLWGTNTINCSTAKDATIGTYDVQGEIVNLR